MVLARRPDKLEAELDPESAVLHWLAEAHEYPTLDAYTHSWKDEPGSEHPLTRLAGQVEEATRQRLKGQRHHDTRGLRRAVRAAAFRVYLVVFLNLEATDSVRVGGLLHLALLWRMRELSFRAVLAEEDEAAAEADTLERDWRSWDAMSRDLIARLREIQTARLDLERRYLGGHGSLFPETGDELRDLAERVEGFYETVAGSGIAPVIEPLGTGLVDEGSGEHTERLAALASTAADAFVGWG